MLASLLDCSVFRHRGIKQVTHIFFLARLYGESDLAASLDLDRPELEILPQGPRFMSEALEYPRDADRGRLLARTSMILSAVGIDDRMIFRASVCSNAPRAASISFTPVIFCIAWLGRGRADLLNQTQYAPLSTPLHRGRSR